MLKYWNETLENIIKDQRKEKFKLVLNNIIFEVPLSYALGISSLITEKYLQDPTFKELNITINNSENNQINGNKIQEGFSNFLKGQNISKELFYEIGINLKNKEMLKQWKQSNELTKETIFKFIEANHKILNKNQNNIENIKEEL